MIEPVPLADVHHAHSILQIGHLYQVKVVINRLGGKQTLVEAVFGNERGLLPDADLRTQSCQLDAVHRDFPFVQLFNPKQNLRQLRSSRPHEAVNPNNLALPDFQRHVFDDSLPADPAGLQDGGANGLLDGGIKVRHFPSDHGLDQLGLGKIRRRCGGDDPSVAQNRDAVTQPEDVIQDVGNIHDRYAAFFQLVNRFEELLLLPL